MDELPSGAKQKMNHKFITPLITAIVFLIAGFGGGMMLQKSQDSLKGLSADKLQTKLTSLGLSNGFGGAVSGRDVNGVRGGAGFPGGARRAGGGFVSGEIVSQDATSITVKDASGSTKIVYYTGSTTISKSVTGTSSDLVVGQNVTTNGTVNSDGSVAATNIQLRVAGETVPPGIPAQ